MERRERYPSNSAAAVTAGAGGTALAVTLDEPVKAHADAGPSSAERWMACPASVTLARGRNRKPTAFTREGTAAHTIAEMVLKGTPIEALPESIEVDGEEVEVTDDMLAHVQTYVSLGDMLWSTSSFFEVEARVSLDWLYRPLPMPEPIHGTADIIAYDDKEKVLTVVDLKYGQGHTVAAVNNPQLRIYALGAMGRIDGHASTIRTVIVQPRGKGEPVKTEDISVDELMHWWTEDLAPAIDRIAEGSTQENPGDHCRFCVRLAECESVHKRAIATAQMEFKKQPPEPRDLSSAEIGAILDQAEVIGAWVTALRAEAASRIDVGQDVPGWKLVQKRAVRKWDSIPAAIESLMDYGLEASQLLTEPELKSPAQIEKVLKKNGFDTKMLESMVLRESSGTTLVRDTDPRDKVLSSPGSVFSVE